jgi:hypothetical protein
MPTWGLLRSGHIFPIYLLTKQEQVFAQSASAFPCPHGNPPTYVLSWYVARHLTSFYRRPNTLRQATKFAPKMPKIKIYSELLNSHNQKLTHDSLVQIRKQGAQEAAQEPEPQERFWSWMRGLDRLNRHQGVTDIDSNKQRTAHTLGLRGWYLLWDQEVEKVVFRLARFSAWFLQVTRLV